MRILITGISGFIGSNLVSYLSKNTNFKLYGICRSEIMDSDVKALIESAEIYQLDKHTLLEILEKVKPDLVIHLASCYLASHTYTDIVNLIQSNIEFPTQLLEAMTLHGVKKFINTGTSWQHYNSEKYDPVNLYAATKEAFDKVITYYVNAKNLRVMTLKLFDTYGPKDKRKKLISLLDDLYKNNAELDMSSGEQEIEIVHIEDVCFAYLVAINQISLNENIKVAEYAINGMEKITLKELVKRYEIANSTKLSINWGKRPYREREVMKLARNLTRLPNWEPKIRLIDGLKITERY